jgi:hypothetical protein
MLTAFLLTLALVCHGDPADPPSASVTSILPPCPSAPADVRTWILARALAKRIDQRGELLDVPGLPADLADVLKQDNLQDAIALVELLAKLDAQRQFVFVVRSER